MDSLYLVMCGLNGLTTNSVQVLKETAKQYQVEKNDAYIYRVSKETINTLNSNSFNTYMFCTDAQIAYKALRERCKRQIQKNQEYARTLEDTLQSIEALICNE